MSFSLENTNIAEVRKMLSKMQENGTFGRIHNLVVFTTEDNLENIVHAVSKQSFCRVIVLSRRSKDSFLNTFDADIHVSENFSSTEIIVIHCSEDNYRNNVDSLISSLLLPDIPIVAWWDSLYPDYLANSEIGRIATRRIVDSGLSLDIVKKINVLANNYTPGDMDLGWTRITTWRSQLAAALDGLDYRILESEVTGNFSSSSSVFLATWLNIMLKVPVYKNSSVVDNEINKVVISTTNGDIVLTRGGSGHAELKKFGSRSQEFFMENPDLSYCLGEELRHSKEDVIFKEILGSFV